METAPRHRLAQRDEPWDAYRLMRSFVESLHGALSARRESLVALASAAAHEKWDVVRELQASLAGFFDGLTAIGGEESDLRGWFPREGLDLAIRLIVAQVLGYVAFESLLMAGADPAVTTERMLDDIASMVIWGLRRGPDDSSAGHR